MCEWRRSGGSGRIERELAHVREEKKGNDVCGRTRWLDREGTGTRQRRKGRKRRVRKDGVAGLKGVWHTSEKKRKETTCAEGRGGRIERSLAHVREEKKGNDVCGEARWPDREEFGTRQRRKERKRRVRKDGVAGLKGVWHTSEKKRKETTCAERRGSR